MCWALATSDGERGFQDVVHRLPELAGRLRSATCVMPMWLSQSASASRSCVMVPNVRVSNCGSPVGTRRDTTGHHGLLVDIQASTMRVDDLHSTTSRCSVTAGRMPQDKETALRASRPLVEYHKVLCQRASRSICAAGSWHQVITTLLPAGGTETSNFHAVMCAPRMASAPECAVCTPAFDCPLRDPVLDPQPSTTVGLRYTTPGTGRRIRSGSARGPHAPPPCAYARPAWCRCCSGTT